MRKQWLDGNPPTYADFAIEWQAEYERNIKQIRNPKQEWAYIRFVQEYIKQFPNASKKEINNAWELKRQNQIKKVNTILLELRKKIKNNS